MINYFGMAKEELQTHQKALEADYQQFVSKNLNLDMSRGKPSLEQLELSMPLLHMDNYIGRTGVDARNYGCLEGMPEAREFFAELLDVSPSEVFVGGNSSLSLEYYLIELGYRKGFSDSHLPWYKGRTKFLCPAPGYDRHFRISQYFDFELITIPMTPQGPDMDIVERLVKDKDVKGIWCVPVYSNPDGYVYSDETVKRLATMETGARDFKVFWDNAYFEHHLTDIQYNCANIMEECKAASNENRPLVFCSTSKMTFSGAGVAALAASEENIKYMLEHIFPMTISYDKLNQLHHVSFFKNLEGVKSHMAKHREILAPKFTTVISLLEEKIGKDGIIATWTNPKGGYFISLYTSKGCARRTVELCKNAGVKLTDAGAAYPYGIDPWDSHIRIAPTFPPLDELVIATQLLCVSTKLATVEKLIKEKS